jgi:hypothetical protein
LIGGAIIVSARLLTLGVEQGRYRIARRKA